MKYILCISLLYLFCLPYTTKSVNKGVKEVTKSPYCIADSTQIGDKGKNKLEICHYGIDTSYIDIRFYEKADYGWELLQQFSFDISLILDIDDTVIKDYNNDGFGDFTYRSGVAARGGNEIRTLFIYSPPTKRLIHIKGMYPNLDYNEELDCLDAFALYGGSTTSFLKIEADSLREFAKVDLWDNHRTVYEIDEQGKETILREDTIEGGPYIRYKNYKTLEEYTEY